MCLRDDQVDAMNRGYTPGDSEIAQARAVVQAYQAATTKGSAVLMQDDRLIDCHVAARAQSLIALAQSQASAGR
jgi:citrate lyase subunit beta / citryl-CoA lyase